MYVVILYAVIICLGIFSFSINIKENEITYEEVELKKSDEKILNSSEKTIVKRE